MRRNGKFLVIIGSLFVLVVAFQNCVVQEDSQGQLVVKEELPQSFDKLNLSLELDGQTESSLVIDLSTDELLYESNFFNPSTLVMETCSETQAIETELRQEIIDKYQASSVCRSLVQAEPGVVCTMQLRPHRFFRVYNESRLVLDEKLGIQPCHSGEASQFCENGKELETLIDEIKQAMKEQCS